MLLIHRYSVSNQGVSEALEVGVFFPKTDNSMPWITQNCIPCLIECTLFVPWQKLGTQIMAALSKIHVSTHKHTKLYNTSVTSKWYTTSFNGRLGVFANWNTAYTLRAFTLIFGGCGEKRWKLKNQTANIICCLFMIPIRNHRNFHFKGYYLM